MLPWGWGLISGKDAHFKRVAWSIMQNQNPPHPPTLSHCTSWRILNSEWPRPRPAGLRSPARYCTRRSQSGTAGGEQTGLKQVSVSTWQLGGEYDQKQTDLGLNSNFKGRTSDGQRVAHDDEDVPAVHKLQAVWPGHHFIEVSVEEYVELLHEKKECQWTNQLDFYIKWTIVWCKICN